jgi:hypothetical protein
VLGNRFSGLVAIQPGHTLVTSGVYGVIRHPSIPAIWDCRSARWVGALPFRSGVGVQLAALLIPPLLARINAEEKLLREQFGGKLRGLPRADVAANAGGLFRNHLPQATIWSTYQPRPNIPQALTNWVPTLPEAAAPPLFCPKSPPLGNQLVNCFSFLCDSQTYINNVPVVTCHCPIGESLAGTPVPPRTAFLTQAGQGDPTTCAKYPVSGPISLP